MVPQEKREAFRAILSGKNVIKPGSVYDPISARIAQDVGFELGFGHAFAADDRPCIIFFHAGLVLDAHQLFGAKVPGPRRLA